MDWIDDILASPPPARGRRKGKESAVYLRDLTPADIHGLRDAKPLGSVAAPLKSLKHIHHSAARLIAEGTSLTDTSYITGYTVAYLSTLQNDPAFQELIAHYRAQVGEIYLNVHERLAALGIHSVEELQERLAVEPDGFSNRELMELSSLCLDRGGYGPSTTKNINATLGVLSPEATEQLRAAISNRGKITQIDTRVEVGKVIEHESVAGEQT